jgi:FKBP-type peptidyl-prolyl cis-trans isomerase SlpA
MIKKGSKVKVHYTGKLANGKVFDTSVEKDPLEVVVGQSGLIKGFEEGLMGMKEGEKKTIELIPEDAYGQLIEGRTQEVEKSMLPEEIQVGMALQANGEVGTMVVTVKEIKEETVVLDANHPLAGKDLIFELEVLEVSNGKKKKKKK